MITTSDIESLGYEEKMVSANGGSKGFVKMYDDLCIIIHSNADNFFYKNENDIRLSEVKIEILYKKWILDKNNKKMPNIIQKYLGSPDTIDELRPIIIEIENSISK